MKYIAVSFILLVIMIGSTMVFMSNSDETEKPTHDKHKENELIISEAGGLSPASFYIGFSSIKGNLHWNISRN